MSHFSGNKNIFPCVLGGVIVGAVFGAVAAVGLAHVWSPAACKKKKPTVGPCDSSGLWDDSQFSHPPEDGVPAGFTMR